MCVVSSAATAAFSVPLENVVHPNGWGCQADILTGATVARANVEHEVRIDLRHIVCPDILYVYHAWSITCASLRR